MVVWGVLGWFGVFPRTAQSVLYLPVHSPGVWCIAIGATPVMDPWMHERHCVAGIGTSIKICEIGLL